MNLSPHDALVQDLVHRLNHYTSSERYIAVSEVTVGAGRGSKRQGCLRFDVVALELGVRTAVAIEVKTRRDDALAWLRGSKPARTAAFGAGVVLAVPEGLVSSSELPQGVELLQKRRSGDWEPFRSVRPHGASPSADLLMGMLCAVKRQIHFKDGISLAEQLIEGAA